MAHFPPPPVSLIWKGDFWTRMSVLLSKNVAIYYRHWCMANCDENRKNRTRKKTLYTEIYYLIVSFYTIFWLIFVSFF